MAKSRRVIPVTMRADGPRKAISDYIRSRLTEECAVRGKASEIARATHLSTAHITNIQKSERGVGDDAARALGTYWGMTFAQLEETAVRWEAAQVGERPPPSSARGRGTWGENPRWELELALAKSMRASMMSHVPERFLLQLAGAVVPDREPTAALILRLAESLFVTEGTDVSGEEKKALAERSPGSQLEPGPKADLDPDGSVDGSKPHIAKTKVPARR